MGGFFNSPFSPQEEKRKRTFIGWGIALSLLLHAFVLSRHYGLFDLESYRPPPPSSEPIEITAAPPDVQKPTEKTRQKPPTPKSKEQEIAETEDLKNREIDPNAKFLGEHDQKSEKQTKAKNIDDFRKKQGEGSKPTHSQVTEAIPPTGENNPSSTEPDTKLTGEGDLARPKKQTKTAGVKRDWKTLSLKDLSVGDGAPTAATDDRLSDVDSGDRTVLSTREFKFYSYYHRIKELLRQYWKPNVENKLYRMYAKGKSINSDEMTTQLLVLLNSNGSIQKIARLGSSGISDLDDAAVEAFQRAGPFPNPPKGMIDPDGFVRIRWDFILKADAGPMIQFRNVGSMPQ